jgi:hypothetical protein
VGNVVSPLPRPAGEVDLSFNNDTGAWYAPAGKLVIGRAAYDCSRERYTVLVLGSVTVKTTRFRLEFRRTSFRAERVYVNGPYIRRYWWDGSIVKSKHITKGKNLRRDLPKKVWVAFRGLLDRPENEEIRRTLIEKLQREAAAIQ